VILLLLVTVVLAQLHVLGSAWGGPLVPDPFACVLAIAGLHGRPGTLLTAAVGMGWARALVFVEPAGGTVLATLFALWIVSEQRETLDKQGALSLALAAGLGACAYALAAFGLRLLGGEPISAGVPIFAGALLAPLLAGPVRVAVRSARRRA
jgi:hypothetical protein